MCGICGSTRDPGGSVVSSMNAAMVARGPDDDGVHIDPNTSVALGARRLSIIDVEGGHQPLSNEDGRVWAALNGEVYNHPTLRRELLATGHQMASGTDTEVLVHLYEEYGADMVHALEGMYAFAIWDAEREELLVVRDRFGEKPLFYAETNGGLSFASELTALLAGLDRTPELEAAAIDAFFVFGYVPGPGSMVQGVRQLPPAHLMRWSRAEGLRVERYWTPEAVPVLQAEDPRELVAETGRLLEASVRSRLLADVPLGVFLSGGLDSTLIAALAAKVSTKPVKTFTVGYDVGTVSETAEAERTASELGCEHHELIISGDQLLARVPELLAGMDQPLADQALVSLHAIAEHARRDVTVAVGGEGADELFAGYPRYRWLARADRFGQMVPAAVGRGLATAARRGPEARIRRLADVVEPMSVVDRHLAWTTFGRREARSVLYGPRLTSAIDMADVPRSLAARLDGDDAKPVVRRLMELDQQHWLPDDVLVKADRAGMRVSLETRTPYLQRELAEFAASLPVEVHLGDSGKLLLRQLLEDVAPVASRRRPKTAFRVPSAEWLRGPLRPLLDRQVEQGALFTEGWFDREETKALIGQHACGAADHANVLWPVLALGLWMDRFRGVEG